MIIIGELINSTRKPVAAAIESRDAEVIRKLAREQAEHPIQYIDVNAGAFERKESEYLQWLVQEVQKEVELPCCIDSPNPQALEAGISVHRGIAMVNSISLEKKRAEGLLPVIAGTDLKVVGLCMSDSGMPRTAEDRVRVADTLVNLLVKNNVKLTNIFIDPLVQPVSTDPTFGHEFLAAVEKIMMLFPGIHTICGLSNVSFGLPLRKFLNQTFMAMAMAKGLDAAIMNPLDQSMMANILAAEALDGRDRFCLSFIKAYRSGRLSAC